MLGSRSWRALGLCYLACAGPARAQSDHWWLGGGLVAPSGEYSMHDKAGWHAMAGFSPRLFDRNGHSDSASTPCTSMSLRRGRRSRTPWLR